MVATSGHADRVCSIHPIRTNDRYLLSFKSPHPHRCSHESALHKPPPAAVGLVCLAIVLLAFAYLVIYPKEFELQSFVTTYRPSSSSAAVSFTEPVTVKPDFRLLLSNLTRADLYERRHLLHLVYSLQTNLTAHVDVRFVLCNFTKEEQRVPTAYFASLPKLFDEDRPPYDFVVKADDGDRPPFRLPKLIESLKKMSREDLYYDFVIPCDSMDPFHEYMSGMGYLLSWDLSS
ncbi:hypothetical protein BHM03_00034100 [Ensete ventricosum]|nr:hypothetical protein BHM03_00034100 [Ensete ventricosum]